MVQKWFNVGKVVNTHGIQGEVRVISKTDFPEERYASGNKLRLFPDNNSQPIDLVVKSHRTHKNFDLLTFEGFTNINEVEHFRGGVLKVQEEQLSSLPEGEFYFHEIIGCSVYTQDGELLGEVKEILTPGANDVWSIQSVSGKEILIPYIPDVVVEVDVHEKRIVIEPMEGLLS